MHYKKTFVLLTSIVVLIVLVIIFLAHGFYRNITSKQIHINSAQSSLFNQTSLNSLTKMNASTADISRIGNNIIPPTNSWISGMVLQSTAKPIYPLPLSFLAETNGFQIGLPNISSTSTAILGEHQPGIDAQIIGATNFSLVGYDKLMAKLSYSSSNNSQIGQLTLAEGSPYIYFRFSKSGSITLDNIGKPETISTEYLRYSFNNHDYFAVTSDGASISQSNGQILITSGSGGLVTFYALNLAQADFLRQYADNVLSSTHYSYQDTKNSVITTLDYQTINGQPTFIAALPYEKYINNPTSFSYSSIYGTMRVYKANQLEYSVPVGKFSNRLDISILTSNQKQELVSSLATDVSQTNINSTDSYFASKQIARAANLLSIAEQLNQQVAISQLKKLLNNAFDTWLTNTHFYYNPVIKGIVAQPNSFGSSDFNDHHFNYGYFIYAASILGQYDQSFINKHADQINLLVADIASYQTNSEFPIDRTYDPYAAHSWAAGLAPFSDGNNQESSSEAIQAWNGLVQWAKLTKNPTLESSGLWMLSNEEYTAQRIWRSVNLDGSGLQNYTSPTVGIIWGGKSVDATFFSAEPSAIVGIQLVPMDPAMASFKSDGQQITKNLNAAISNDNYNVPLGDYLLMYLSLVNPSKASQLSPTLLNSNIDNGDSRTYLNAWIDIQLQTNI